MTEKTKLLAHLKPFVNDMATWQAFEAYVNALIDLNATTLEQETDLLKIGRCQGRADALRGMLQLRKQANSIH